MAWQYTTKDGTIFDDFMDMWNSDNRCQHMKEYLSWNIFILFNLDSEEQAEDVYMQMQTLALVEVRKDDPDRSIKIEDIQRDADVALIKTLIKMRKNQEHKGYIFTKGIVNEAK